ncbi:hypothetical protein OIY81_739 [Cryptosporidium canis]|uniref:Uncharacterized protein n=1 Tax=Cryptosporidium canis TaxID=195482 RepID=A0ABQ8PBD0_9CRYT|nr:hypothetical protein OIY81_739 [Cryptosporidium canis]KAJ1615279.1 hypothetical protein OJ252_282 [Cryptosporidium canis]
MKRELIKIFFFILKLLVTRSVQLDIINDKYKEAIQTEVLPATISRIIAIKNQLRVFDESIEDVSAKSSSFFTFTSNNLNEFMGLTQETTLGSNRGAFVIYDTNDYPFACMCNSAQYQNWISAGKDPNTKVECANTINTGIFNSNDIDYCDPTNVAASQSS